MLQEIESERERERDELASVEKEWNYIKVVITNAVDETIGETKSKSL